MTPAQSDHLQNDLPAVIALNNAFEVHPHHGDAISEATAKLRGKVVDVSRLLPLDGGKNGNNT
jgi:hypothetical protein